MHIFKRLFIVANVRLTCVSDTAAGGTEVVTESDFHNGHAVLDTGSVGRLSREKMVYMAVKDSCQGDEDISECGTVG